MRSLIYTAAIRVDAHSKSIVLHGSLSCESHLFTAQTFLPYSFTCTAVVAVTSINANTQSCAFPSHESHTFLSQRHRTGLFQRVHDISDSRHQTLSDCRAQLPGQSVCICNVNCLQLHNSTYIPQRHTT